MRKCGIIIICLITLSGCATAKISKTEETCSAQYVSMFKSMENVDMSACGAKGSGVNTKTDLSSVLIEALIKGLE